jgi:hypothetical protein
MVSIELLRKQLEAAHEKKVIQSFLMSALSFPVIVEGECRTTCASITFFPETPLGVRREVAEYIEKTYPDLVTTLYHTTDTVLFIDFRDKNK